MGYKEVVEYLRPSISLVFGSLESKIKAANILIKRYKSELKGEVPFGTYIYLTIPEEKWWEYVIPDSAYIKEGKKLIKELKKERKKNAELFLKSLSSRKSNEYSVNFIGQDKWKLNSNEYSKNYIGLDEWKLNLVKKLKQ